MTSHVPVFMALGSNVEPETNLRRAVHLLAERLPIRAVSRVYRTVALDANGQPLPDHPPFLNAALLGETTLPPAALKFDVLRPLEARLGRSRSGHDRIIHPIDLDLVLYGDLVLDDPASGLRLPDPDILTRAYMALPLADLAPDFIHPVTGQTLAEIAAAFAGQPDITISPLILSG
ncbi:MAG TPA: 2-amino-4-hydroxy-6-hydroxymethyldihydropteridine diphosphokinase [Chloroflexi bacterium]|nr:2-amino-4-hydroxy-6-hydroxymethyldihydropteridine diphosphokinase [Chloroflexota bacterium]